MGARQVKIYWNMKIAECDAKHFEPVDYCSEELFKKAESPPVMCFILNE